MQSGFGDGSTADLRADALGQLGAVICWENYMPLLRPTPCTRRTVTIYCAPTADDRDSSAGTMRHVALEGRCFRAVGLPVPAPRRLPRSA